MASRTSAMFDSEMYLGTRRGRSASGDMGWELFPEKLERTDIDEDPEQLSNDWRATLKDLTPEAPTFAYEAPRRNTMARSHLNLRDGGVFGSTTDPYASDDYDTQFHDKDPRGYLTEQPWEDYREQLASRFRMFDYKDDGDYSTTGGGVHPNTLYSAIRTAQNWTKARLKIFDTSYEGRSNGGVGVYANVSKVFKSDLEDTSVAGNEEDGMMMTWEDPENRQRLTMHLSNIVHGGSRMWRAETTTDHKVPVAAYGKLYSQRGLIPHESQLRILEDDTPWSRVEGARNVPKNLVKLMATALEDRGGIDAKTAAASARLMYHNAAGQGHGEEQFRGVRGEELSLDNRSVILTKDIMALLGFVEQDVKFLESRASDPGKQGKRARRALADLYHMAEVLHALPANVKLDMRSELVLRSGGFGLGPANGAKFRHAQNQVVVNPKIMQRLDLLVRRNEKPSAEGGRSNRRAADGDSEDILNKRNHLNGPLFVYKSVSRASEDIDFNRRESDGQDHRAYGKHVDGMTTASYKNLKKYAQRIERNKRLAAPAQTYTEAGQALIYKTQNRGETDFHELMIHSVLDNDFGENKALTRHVGRIGSKNMRRYQDSDYAPLDFAREKGAVPRKNSRNLNRN
jgi:hypothetical protein